MRRFSSDLTRGWGRLAWLVVALSGVAAEGVAFGAGDARDAIPDLLAGWALLGAGLYVLERAPGEACGAQLAAGGAAWFAGDVFEPLLYLHRGFLLQALVLYPTGRARSTADRALVAAGYLAALAAPLWRDDVTSIVASGILVAVLVGRYLSVAGPARRARRHALGGGIALAVAIGCGAGARLAFPSGDADELVLVIYEAIVAAVAWWLGVGIVARPWDRVPVTDVVVDLTDRPQTSLPARLARMLGDPGLRVVEPDGETDAHADRATTLVYRDGAAVAAVVHDRSIAADGSLREAVSAVAALTAAHARLEAESRARVQELAASRRRVLHAAEDERRRLELELRARAVVPLAVLRERLMDARVAHSGDVDRLVGEACGRIAFAIADLEAIALGLHPRALSEGGLARGLRELAATSGVEAYVDADLPRLAEEVEAAVYYACAEALANAAKHARARRVVVNAGLGDGRLRLSVRDDGAGGAQMVRGGGLEGLRDRVEAIGGQLTVDRPAGGGTRVVVMLPI